MHVRLHWYTCTDRERIHAGHRIQQHTLRDTKGGHLPDGMQGRRDNMMTQSLVCAANIPTRLGTFCRWRYAACCRDRNADLSRTAAADMPPASGKSPSGGCVGSGAAPLMKRAGRRRRVQDQPAHSCACCKSLAFDAGVATHCGLCRSRGQWEQDSAATQHWNTDCMRLLCIVGFLPQRDCVPIRAAIRVCTGLLCPVPAWL